MDEAKIVVKDSLKCKRGHRLWIGEEGMSCDRCEADDRHKEILDNSRKVVESNALDVKARSAYQAWAREFDERRHVQWCERVDTQTKAINEQTQALNKIAEAISEFAKQPAKLEGPANMGFV